VVWPSCIGSGAGWQPAPAKMASPQSAASLALSVLMPLRLRIVVEGGRGVRRRHNLAMEEQGWYGVRTIYEWTDYAHGRDRCYEERIVLVRAKSHIEAIDLAEKEAKTYAKEGIRYLGHVVGFEIDLGVEPDEGVEVFSLLRESRMEPKRYIDRYFDTGRERATNVC
jgi:hypothetical protein